MRYIVTKSEIDVIGTIWMPSITAAMKYTLNPGEVDLIRTYNDNGKITREGIQRWVDLYTGDFQSIEDWRADIADGDTDVIFDWTDPASADTFAACMFDNDF